MNARRLTLAMVCAVAEALALASAPAMAQFTHSYLSQLSGFGNPVALSVGPGGDLYVADSGARVVDRLNSSGAPVSFSAVESYVEGSRLTGTPSGPFEQPQGVAVSNSTGDIYVADAARHVVDVFSSSGEYLSQITGTPPSATVNGPFQLPSGLAVDQSTGELYVTDPHSGVVDVFSSSGEYVSQFGNGVLGGSYGESIAVNDLTGSAYVGDSGPDAVFVFNSLGNLVPPEWHGAGTPNGSFGGGYVYVGLDQSSGHEYVAETAGAVVDEFGSSTSEEFLDQITGPPAGAFNKPQAVTVDPSSGVLYVADGSGVVDAFGPLVVIPDVATGALSSRTAHSVALTGTVNPDGAGSVTCSFEYGITTAYGQSVACLENVPSGNTPVTVSAAIAGLAADSTYHFRLKASNSNGTNTSPDGEFRTAGPEIASASTTNVAADSATLQAQVDPNGSDTHYYVQYGTSTAYGSTAPQPPGDELSAAAGPQSVSIHVQGLQPGTLYHYKVLVSNEAGTAESADQTFTTQSAGNQAAPLDGRAWEMVSPPDKHGALLQRIANAGLIQAAADGSAFSYLADVPTEAAARGDAVAVQVLSRRGADGWSSQDIATPHNAPTGPSVGQGYEYRFFSPDLSQALVEPQGEFTPLAGEETSPPASERTLYRRSDFTCQATPASCYTPLVTSVNVPPRTKFGGDPEALRGSVRFVGATPDLQTVVLSSEIPLTADANEIDSNLYEWVDGRLQLVSSTPEGEPFPAIDAELAVARGRSNARNAISSDGSRIVWSANGVEGAGLRLYMRDVADQKTVRLDLPQPGFSVGGEAEARFQTASSDGSRVFFTDSQRLTTDATGNDLYMCEMVRVSGALSCRLRDLSIDTEPGGSAGVLEFVPGASEDGSRVYFVATGVLATGASAGQPNLYVAGDQAGTWTTTLVATLAQGDNPDWGEPPAGGLPGLTSRVSPDGRYLAFMSARSLTGYDTRDAVTGNPDEEVYLYDAASGKLVCGSCDPTGARPTGVQFAFGTFQEPLVIGFDVWEASVAANVPGWMPYAGRLSLYQPRYLSNSGRLFFNSSDALVPQDVNGNEDVYEYEPLGIGNCAGSSAGFSASSGGCVGLISSGASSEESAFLDASESGGDVFFLTSSRLLAQDYDTSLDVYDAHECSIAAPCVPPAAVAPPACSTGDSCKAAPSPQPPIFGSPPSATFSGAGNVLPPRAAGAVRSRASVRAARLASALKACRKRPHRKRAGCERLARRRYGAKTSPATGSLSRGSGR